MNLVVSVRATLEDRYKLEGSALIKAALDRYVAATAGQSRMLFLDDVVAMASAGAQPVAAVTQRAILDAIRALHSVIPGIDSLFIIGNDGVVPYWQLENPVTNRVLDPDTVVYSDNPYGSLADSLEEYLAPSLAVGRLCDTPKGSAADFVAAIDSVTANRQAAVSRLGSTAIINDEWIDASMRVFPALPSPVEQHLAPGFAITSLTVEETTRRYVYVNLHGFEDDPAWKAYDRIAGQFVSVATPAVFADTRIEGSIIFAENCYGALTIDKTPRTSCALRLIERGAAGFIGSTGLAFGSHLESDTFFENADRLAGAFFAALINDSQPTGAALVAARQSLVNDVKESGMTVFHEKTLLQFNLLGDPSSN